MSGSGRFLSKPVNCKSKQVRFQRESIFRHPMYKQMLCVRKVMSVGMCTSSVPTPSFHLQYCSSICVNSEWKFRTEYYGAFYKVKYDVSFCISILYNLSNKNPSAWSFLSPEPEVTCGTVAIIIRVVLLSSYLRIRKVSLSSIHYNQSHRVYINRRQQYICLIWN